MVDLKYLKAGEFINSDHPAVREYAEKHGKTNVSDIEQAINFYYVIRDGIRYNPYISVRNKKHYTASGAVLSGEGWCVPKAALMAACLRATGIPARTGYADVKNHLASDRLLNLLGSDLFVWHSYCETYLDNNWVKCTPSFNLALCEKFGLKPLEFDGKSDSLFHEFDKVGNRHMEYVRDRGIYDDVPIEEIIESFIQEYRTEYIENVGGDLYAEADLERRDDPRIEL